MTDLGELDPVWSDVRWRVINGHPYFNVTLTNEPTDWRPLGPEFLERYNTLERLVLWVSLGYEP